ncbi:MAG: alpha-ketoacid dehydrogenase subunit beta [Pseudomonadales bacterium]|jgi:pyruvate dehydrogenase E1 component beta subunit
MAEHNLLEAVNLALRRAMQEDERVVVLGEDVGVNGGVFRATEGLLDAFGAKRVLDTPLAETLIAGVSVGLAAQGMRPVAEIQFMGFIYPTLDQMINHASRLRTRTRGRLSCPMVLRAPYGGGVHAPEHHSESTEALFAHVPGLRVVIPSTPTDAYGLLLSAIRDPDPVVFLEPKRLYRLVKEEIVDDGTGAELDRCRVRRDGDDLTLVCWGAMMHETLEAAETLSERGISAAVIDVATLKPLDAATILESVARTGRVVIVHEAALTGGFGAEVAARIAEEGLFDLRAPVARVAGWDTVMPLPRLEKAYLPDTARILAAAERVLSYD